MEGDYGVLEGIRDIMATSRSFHETVRFLNTTSRNQVVMAHERNANMALTLMHEWMGQTTLVMNIPPSNFEEPVRVTPSQLQVVAATDTIISSTDENQCPVCQEIIVGTHTRISHCHHSFHQNCLNEWFRNSPRCPVCRYDIRDFQPPADTTNNDNRRNTNR